ncbi:MAG: hypothetical protein WB729_08125 [Candidatus Sulfotelmatobacter sp.]
MDRWIVDYARKKYAGPLQAVILDWAGTTLDYGSLAPVRVLQQIFADQGIQVSEDEVRPGYPPNLTRNEMPGHIGQRRYAEHNKEVFEFQAHESHPRL